MSVYDADFFAGRRQTVALSASVVAPVIVGLVQPESVLDVGCGQGEWTYEFSRLLPDVFGVDIAAPTAERFARHDLTVPLNLERDFDLVVCLEVGEHLPEDAADTLVASLVQHGGDIMFSAATPGQAGKGHINCQPHDYWHTKFEAYGYETHDVIRPRIARDSRVSPWYRDNTFLYLEDLA